MRKLKYLLIMFFVFIFIDNIQAFDTTLKIYDYAQVLTTEEESNLKRNLDLYIANNSIDMVIVTVKYHTKDSTIEYASDFYNYNRFGVGTNFDGIILVLDFTFLDSGDISISTKGKALDVYTDSRIDMILDSVVAKKNNGYYEMFNKFIEESNYYAKQGVMLNRNISTNKSFAWKKIIIISLIIPSIIILLLILKNKMVKKNTNAIVYLLKDSVVINKKNAKFVTTHTTSTRINENNSSAESSSKNQKSSSVRSRKLGR